MFLYLYLIIVSFYCFIYIIIYIYIFVFICPMTMVAGIGFATLQRRCGAVSSSEQRTFCYMKRSSSRAPRRPKGARSRGPETLVEIVYMRRGFGASAPKPRRSAHFAPGFRRLRAESPALSPCISTKNE